MSEEEPGQLIRALGDFLEQLRKGKSVNALHKEILDGAQSPLWNLLPEAARRARYQNVTDYSEHWTAMRRGTRLPKFDRLVVPAVVALSLDEESLRRNLANAEQLWTAANRSLRAAEEHSAEQISAPVPRTSAVQLNHVAGQGNRVFIVQEGNLTVGES